MTSKIYLISSAICFLLAYYSGESYQRKDTGVIMLRVVFISIAIIFTVIAFWRGF